MTAPPTAAKPFPRPVAGAAPLPGTSRAQIGHWVGIAVGSEEQLRDALLMVASRHAGDGDIRDGARMLAGWARAHIELGHGLQRRLGPATSEEPERLRSALFFGTRVGGVGLLADLQDLGILATAVRSSWTVLSQAADEIHDAELVTVADEAGRQTDRTRVWIETHLKQAAPQVLTVPVDAPAEARASVPPTPRVASIPDPIFGPLVAGALILLAGLVGLLLGRPVLFASLGPTAYLQADQPANPVSRLWNAIGGHLSGAVAGLIGVALFAAWNSPTPLVDHLLPPERVGASVVAIVLTIIFAAVLRASHPPAAATALLISLGAIKTTQDLVNLAIGVVVVSVAGEVARRVRLRGLMTHPARRSLTAPTALARSEQPSA
jgi:hypothetical protein